VKLAVKLMTRLFPVQVHALAATVPAVAQVANACEACSSLRLAMVA
jgi:hypothetical protein